MFQRIIIVLAFVSAINIVCTLESGAQTFRTFQTTTQEVTYTTRTLTNGNVVVETVINTVVVDLTPNPVTATSAVETDETNNTLILTSAAVTALKAAIATAAAAADASATVIAETVAATIDDTDKAKDPTGAAWESISYVETVDGQLTFGSSTAGEVSEETVTTSQRAEFDTIVETVKAIVSAN